MTGLFASGCGLILAGLFLVFLIILLFVFPLGAVALVVLTIFGNILAGIKK